MMELDDFKNTWNETKMKILNGQMIEPETMVKRHTKKYGSKLKQITIPEAIGSLVCLAAAAYIGFHFHQLDTVVLQGAGVLSILLLLLLPTISTLSTWQLKPTYDVHRPYAQTLKAFAHHKVRFVKLQKLNVTLSYLLLISVIVLMSKLLGDKDLSDNTYFWLFSFTMGYVFLMFYSKWVEKYYRKTLQQAEELLKELAV